MDDESLMELIREDDYDIFISLVPKKINSSHSLAVKNFPRILLDSPSMISAAAFFGSMQILNYLIEIKADMNQCDLKKRDCPHLAVAGGSLAAIQTLANAGADFNKSIILAAGIDDIQVFKYLVENLGVDVSQKDLFGSTPLHACCMSGDLRTLAYILSLNKIDVNVKDNYGNTPLHCAVLYGSTIIVKRLLKEPGIDISPTNNEMRTTLHLAAEKPTPEILSSIVDRIERAPEPQWDFMTMDLIELGVDIETISAPDPVSDSQSPLNISDKAGLTPFLSAVKSGGVEVVRYLLGVGDTDVTVVDSEGRNALHLAVSSDRLNILNTLLKEGSGIDVNAQDANGETPLMLAAEASRKEFVQLLLSTPGIDPNIIDARKRSALHFAVSKNDPGVAALLLSSPSLRVDTEVMSETPLHIAAKSGSVELIQMLLRRGADASKRDGYGMTALHCASKFNKPDAVRVLLEAKGCDPNTGDSDGWTALHYAARSGNLECAEILASNTRVDINALNMRKQTPMFLSVDNNMRKIFEKFGGHD